MLKLAINGFGRIGRAVFRVAHTNPNIEVVAINDLADSKTLGDLLKYDSVYGMFNETITAEEDKLNVGGKEISVYKQPDPEKLPWDKHEIDVVIESTGVFTSHEGANQHIKAGAKKVILSAPAKDGNVPTYVIGVNDGRYAGEKIISNASCTTNCIAPVADIVEKNFGVKKSFMTTAHAYTGDQNLHDGPHKDMRRARAAATNIVPTSTGAAIAATQAIPKLKGKFDGMAIRVPVICGSISDMVFLTEKNTSVEDINSVFERAAEDPKYKNILTTSNEPIVSSDIIGNPHSSIVDLPLTKVIGNDFVKVVAWYDNEWGYSNRMIDTALLIHNYIK